MAGKLIYAYPYTQYNDSDDIQSFFLAYNEIAQYYLDWGIDNPLAYWWGDSGALLDWVALGLYGFARPTVSYGQAPATGDLNTFDLNTLDLNGSTDAVPPIVDPVTDDRLQKMLTWGLYKGDGKNFSIPWLKRRIVRFLQGGITPVSSTYQVSVRVSNGNFTILIYTNGPMDTSDAVFLQQAIYLKLLELPSQYTFNVRIAVAPTRTLDGSWELNGAYTLDGLF